MHWFCKVGKDFHVVGSEEESKENLSWYLETMEVEDQEINSLKTISIATPGTKSLDFLMPQLHPHSSEDGLKSGSC